MISIHARAGPTPWALGVLHARARSVHHPLTPWVLACRSAQHSPPPMCTCSYHGRRHRAELQAITIDLHPFTLPEISCTCAPPPPPPTPSLTCLWTVEKETATVVTHQSFQLRAAWRAERPMQAYHHICKQPAPALACPLPSLEASAATLRVPIELIPEKSSARACGFRAPRAEGE
jgi:hypothetical protein